LISDNLKLNQFSLSMQTLDTNDQNAANSFMAKDCDPVAPPKASNLSSPIPNSSSVSGPSSSNSQTQMAAPLMPATQKGYDYLLKVLLVGDSDVGKQEIISDMEDGTTDSPFCSSAGAGFKTTIILIDGKRVKLQLWDTSGQGRFCTIIRSYSRGAQGILLVYDITNKWSFEGINRWLKEVDQHAPGIPKVLVGNRLHLAFKRQVHQEEAEEYAEKHSMGFFEVSPLVNFNISETLVELARMALRRNGMERWNGRSNKVSTLYELCAHSIVNRTTVYGIDRLKLPSSVKQNLKSYAVTNYSISQTQKKFLRRPGSSSQYYTSGSFKNKQSGGSPASSICNSLRRVHRTRQHTPLANTPADAANVNCGPNRKSCTIS
jgi:Ras-related protein Rab-40